MNKLKALFLSLVTVLAFAVPLTASAAAPTLSIANNLCGGANLDATSAKAACNEGEAETKVTGLIAGIINIFSLVVGAISVIMIIIGGLKYITSGGDSGNVSGAKNTILYAVVGLVVVALAQIIVRFVLGRLNTALQ